jgi:MoaA/NifB/PqqE/SkfB family radical SAM enzyme
MIFDAYGNVQGCCANALYPLGNVADDSLRSIWQGPRAVALRAALAKGDLSFGCGLCRHRLDHASGDVPRDIYTQFVPAAEAMGNDWPALLSFSLHNTCNLACVMCGGDASSRIRTQRDGLPGLPHRYGDAFFEQIIPFLDHCTNVDFVGGEPLLVREHARIWDLLEERGRNVGVSITTNGTIWHKRLEHWLDRFDTTVLISIDGVTASTFESIRVGASFDVVMANLERYRSYTAERGTELIISWSLVNRNWHEMPAMFAWAEERGLRMQVQTVLEPDHGVQRMETEALRHATETLEAASVDLAPQLIINREVWVREIGRLRIELDARASAEPRRWSMEPPSPSGADHVAEMVRTWCLDRRPPRRRWLPSRAPGASRRQQTQRELASTASLQRWSTGGPVGEVELDRDMRIVRANVGTALGVDPNRLDLRPGVRFDSLLRSAAQALGAEMWVAEEFADVDEVRHLLLFGRDVRDKRGVVVQVVSHPRPDGVTVRLGHDAALMRDVQRGEPVNLRLRSALAPN